MKRKTFVVNTKFIFEGKFYVKADSKEQAREFVEKHCGLVIGRDTHSSLRDDMIDWEFDVHPEKEIGDIHTKK